MWEWNYIVWLMNGSHYVWLKLVSMDYGWEMIWFQE
jgi:hypothetical protein